MDPPGTEGALEQLLDGALEALLIGRAILLGLGRQRALHGAVAAAREQRALVVDQRDPFGDQARDRGRDQVLHRQHLAAVEAAPAVHAQRDRRAGLDLVAPEQLAPRQHQVNARGFDAGERADRARELALQRAAQIDVGEEVGGAERARVIEDLVADRAASRQAFLGQRHAQAQRLVGRHHHGLAVALQTVGHAQRLEAADDLGAVVELQTAVEQGVGRFDRAQEQVGEEREQGERGGAQDQEPARAERAQDAQAPRRGRARVAVGGGSIVARRKLAERLIHWLVVRA